MDFFAKQNTRLTDAAQKIAEEIKKRAGRALIVGGFVRDSFLNISSKDIDIEVYNISPEALHDVLKNLFKNNVIEAGKSFGVLKIPLGDGLDIDVALPRRESKSGKGHKGFLIESDPSMDPTEAARRRDFTINAIAIDPLSGEILDPFNGQTDLNKKILRVVDPQTFQDDPLRVYRALQFTARFDLNVESRTLDLTRNMVSRGDLDELSKERVSEEIKKLLLKAEKPSIGLQLAWDLGLIECDYPELSALKITPQEPAWHPEGDVWIHTLMAVDQAAKMIRIEPFTDNEKLQIMVGTLCHDLGKPSTTAIGEKDGIPRIRSLGHEEAGEEPTKQLLAKWSMGFEVEHAALTIATQHLKPGMLFNQKTKGTLTDEQYANAVRKLIKKIYPLSWRVLLAAAEADHRGRALPGAETKPYEIGALFTQMVKSLKLDEAPAKPLIQGRDLLKRGMKPGPQVGELLNRIENARDEGKIKTHEEAITLLDKILEEEG